MIEKAVFEYYIALGYSLSPHARDIPFDFIITKDEESIGVEIKYTNTAKLHLTAVGTLLKFRQAWANYQKATGLTKIRLVFVLADYSPEYSITNLLENFQSFRPHLLGMIELHIGKLDTDNRYISLFELTTDKI